jgi:hypothetical protein
VKNPLLVKHVDVWPLMLIHAQDTKHGGAARLHVLASTLDHNEGCNHVLGICKGGSGKIETEVLRDAALSLGVKRSTFYNWLDDAKKPNKLTGLAIFTESNGVLYLASQAKLTQIYLCNSIDQRKAIIPLKLLFKPGWKNLVWQAYKKANHNKIVDYKLAKPTKQRETWERQPVTRGKIVSTKKLEDLTGVSPRQQRRYNAGIKQHSNIAITTIAGSWETADALNAAAQDQGKDRHYFTFNDPNQTDPAGVKDYRRVIAHTMPNRQTVKDSTAKLGAYGRRRQLGAAIKKGLRLVNSCNYPLSLLARPRQANGQPSNSETFVKFARFYFENEPKQERRNSSTREVIELEARETYNLRRNTRRGLGVWDAKGDYV